MAVIIDESKLPEFIHEMADARTRRANHLRQSFLTDLGNDRLGSPFLTEVCQ